LPTQDRRSRPQRQSRGSSAPGNGSWSPRAAPAPRSPPNCTSASAPDRIRDKTACRRRADLTRLALGAGLV